MPVAAHTKTRYLDEKEKFHNYLFSLGVKTISWFARTVSKDVLQIFWCAHCETGSEFDAWISLSNQNSPALSESAPTQDSAKFRDETFLCVEILILFRDWGMSRTPERTQVDRLWFSLATELISLRATRWECAPTCTLRVAWGLECPTSRCQLWC